MRQEDDPAAYQAYQGQDQNRSSGQVFGFFYVFIFFCGDGVTGFFNGCVEYFCRHHQTNAEQYDQPLCRADGEYKSENDHQQCRGCMNAHVGFTFKGCRNAGAGIAERSQETVHAVKLTGIFRFQSCWWICAVPFHAPGGVHDAGKDHEQSNASCK